MSLSSTRRWWAVAALVPAALVLGIDATVLGLALPTLAADLEATTSQLQWFFSAYMLAFAAAMIPGGMLGDRYGRKRLLLASLVVFGLGSIACAYAPSASAFIGARVLLGLGAAVVLPTMIGALLVMFSEEERPKAIAAIMTATMLGYPIGPILGGWMLTEFWWGSVFLINVPVVIVALAGVAALLPESRSELRPRFDVPGIALSAAGLSALTYGLIRAGQDGWSDALALTAMAAGGAVTAVFVLWERRAPGPLVDLALFRSRGFAWGTALATLVSFTLFGIMFATPLYFQEVLGTTALGNGLRQLPLVGGLIIGALGGTRLAERLGPRVAVSLGFAVLAGGLALGGSTDAADGSGFAVAWLAVCGLGIGLALPTSMDAALGALSADRSAVGSGLVQALRGVGGTFGAAVLGSLLSAAYLERLDVTGLPPAAAELARDGVSGGVAVARQLDSAALLENVQAAFIHGMNVALLACAALAMVGAVAAALLLPRHAAATARGAGHEIESGHDAGRDGQEAPGAAATVVARE
ncbi:MAG TPA: DHA2 family efflux MFS transporter permease subunit [Thermoleophilia bacterium]|nr:DHA2 family efflux MFS transporter permease subunit [Thermoleophilia bacterium]